MTEYTTRPLTGEEQDRLLNKLLITLGTTDRRDAVLRTIAELGLGIFVAEEAPISRKGLAELAEANGWSELVSTTQSDDWFRRGDFEIRVGWRLQDKQTFVASFAERREGFETPDLADGTHALDQAIAWLTEEVSR